MASFPGSFPARAFFLCILLFAVGGCAAGNRDGDTFSKRYTARDINPNPSILNNAIVKGTDLSGLSLSNVTVKNATLYNVTGKNVVLRNVTFDNCRLMNADFQGATLDNVTFKGGILTSENGPNDKDRNTRFTASRFNNLTIDGTYLENPLFEGAGTVTIRNVHQAAAVEPMVSGSGVHLTLERSIFRHIALAEIAGGSTLTATDCRFEYAFFGNSVLERADYARNVLLGTTLPEGTRRSVRRK